MLIKISSRKIKDSMKLEGNQSYVVNRSMDHDLIPKKIDFQINNYGKKIYLKFEKS